MIVDAANLADIPNALAHLAWFAEQIEPRDDCLAAGWGQERRQHPQRRCLPRSIRPKKSEDLPLANVEVDTTHRLDRRFARFETLFQITCFNHFHRSIHSIR